LELSLLSQSPQKPFWDSKEQIQSASSTSGDKVTWETDGWISRPLDYMILGPLYGPSAQINPPKKCPKFIPKCPKFRINSVKICVYDAKIPNSVKNWCVPNNVIEKPGIGTHGLLIPPRLMP
jgi:hypothetical protein